MKFYKSLISLIFISAMLLTNAAFASEPVKSATLTIDETEVSLILGGSMGGGTLMFQGKSYKFKTGGIKLGGIGVHKIQLVGDVYDLKKIEDFAGIYGSFQVGATLGEASKNSIWVKNTNGVKLNLKSTAGEGVALALGVEGLKITME